MADRTISELTPVTTVNPDDSFVLQQNDRAMRLTGRVLTAWLLHEMDGHGGINNIAKTSTSGITDTYTITYADETTSTFSVTNGRGITGVSKTSTSGLVDTYTIAYNSGSNDTFTVTNGNGINNVTKSSSGLADTYRMNYTNGSHYDFVLTNGKGITSITNTSTSGLNDTYTIAYNDGTSSTFVVHNGRGITDISKSSTSGLVDTYSIQYNDNTSGTFDVTNGEKGDNAYTWVKYSHERPLNDSSMHDTPDAWMGIHVGYESTAPSSYTAYQWYQIKGDQGDKGDNPIVTTSVAYGKSSSSTITPTDWYTTIPTVDQGWFLWTRTQLSYSTGGNSEFYSVTRYGMDGAGSVSSVDNISPDSNGNIELTTRAPVDSPALTGTPTAPTAQAGTDTTQIATTAFANTNLPIKAEATLTNSATSNQSVSVDVSNSKITASHTVISCDISDLTACASDITFTPASGKVTVSCTMRAGKSVNVTAFLSRTY